MFVAAVRFCADVFCYPVALHFIPVITACVHNQGVFLEDTCVCPTRGLQKITPVGERYKATQIFPPKRRGVYPNPLKRGKNGEYDFPGALEEGSLSARLISKKVC